jgi:hypothetical protein
MYRSFSSDVTAAILVYQNNEMAAILVYGTGISSFLLKYLVLFHHPTGATDHVSENDLYICMYVCVYMYVYVYMCVYISTNICYYLLEKGGASHGTSIQPRSHLPFWAS